MKNKDTEALKELILMLIPRGRENRITLSYLQHTTDLSKRDLKELIAQLRIEAPIVAQETDGGGYWIATSEMEVKEFIAMIARHRDAFNKTINIMQEHLINHNPIGGKLF